jgi:FAD/FMN-containing dehydrogenase
MISRARGLTLDWLIGAKVVLADGSIVHCSATENEDLFWALRGAGSSFGIVAELKFNTFKAPDRVTTFTINLSWNKARAIEGIKVLQDFVATAPKELNMMFTMRPAGQRIEGVYYGGQKSLNDLIQPFLQQIGGQNLSVSTMGWIEGLKHFAYGQPLNQTQFVNMVCQILLRVVHVKITG